MSSRTFGRPAPAILRRWVLGVLALVVSACSGEDPLSGPPEDAEEPGRLVIIGGALDAANTAVYQEILQGRSGPGPVCVFPTASASPQESMESAVERIEAVGGSGAAQGIYLTLGNPEDAGTEATAERIRGCSGFYFSGGSQSRIAEVFRPDGEDSRALQAVRQRFREGAVVSGTSAGAAIMTDPMIGGGSSLGALASGVREEGGEDGVILQNGLGFLPDVLVDQHFLARGRWARLLVAVLATEGRDLGLGIDENTALVVEGDSARVVGESGVVLFDTRQAGDWAGGSAEISGVRMFLLGAYDRVYLDSGVVSFFDGKGALTAQGSPLDAGEMDLFDRWNLLRFFAESAGSAQGSFSFDQHGYGFRIQKGEGFVGLGQPGEGVQGVPRNLAAGPYLLSIVPDSAS